MLRRLCLVCVLAGLGGCIMQNLSPETRLRDSVIELNDEARWGRMDIATLRVAPSFREQYRLSHLRWGRDIQIADTEILGMKANKDDGGAVSRVAVRWYDQRSMILADTVLRQTWQKHKQTFILISEAVESGHPGLLAIPEVEAPIEDVPAPQDLEEEAQVFEAG